jgi:hypothetical protein
MPQEHDCQTQPQAKDVDRELLVIDLARAQHQREGWCEIDYDALVSEGGDNGAYVQAWVWVNFADTELDKD